jgi:hypothetical protein
MAESKRRKIHIFKLNNLIFTTQNISSFYSNTNEYITAIFKIKNFWIWRPSGASHCLPRQLATPSRVTKRGGESEWKGL